MNGVHEYILSPAVSRVVDRIEESPGQWGFVIIKRVYLRSMTNEAFVLALSPVLTSVAESHVVYTESGNVYVAWLGKQKVIYKLLRNLVSTGLMRHGLSVGPSVLVPYVDPAVRLPEIRELLCPPKPVRRHDDDDDDIMDLDPDNDASGGTNLKASPEQVDLYQHACGQKAYRRQLNILVVEDQVYSQKLLCEILRGVRVRNNNESPCIDAVQGVRDAWKLFLKRAPDISFIDLNLADGSGHVLARAIKELDPQAQIVIVTANTSEEEMNVARQNNVDGFITKPYNKKQILDGIERYVESTKPGRGLRHGTTGQF